MLSSVFVRGIRVSSGTRSLKNATVPSHTGHVKENEQKQLVESQGHSFVHAVHFHKVLNRFTLSQFRGRHKKQTAQTVRECMSGAIRA